MQGGAVGLVGGGDLLQVGHRGDQLGRDPGVLGPRLQEHLQELDHGAGALGRRLGLGPFDVGGVGLGAGQGLPDGVQQLRGEAGARESLGRRAEPGQGVQIGRGLGGDLVDRVVLDDPPARLVADLGGLFAPRGHGLEHRHVLGRVPPGFQPLPGVLRRHVVVGGVDEPQHLLLDPGEAAFTLQPLTQHRI